MKQTMVEVFNQLTHSELADYTLFEEILDKHFEKLRLFYWSTCDLATDITKTVKGVTCYCTDSGLLITVNFSSAKNCEKYKEALDEYVDSNDLSENGDYFDFVAEIKSSKKLNISIENKTISREDEIHENRFDSH